MQFINKKRFRAANWDSKEKSLLIEVINETCGVGVLEDKKTDTNTNKAKAAAWDLVHKRFLKLNERSRLLSELKQQWRTLKLDTKKDLTDYRQVQYQTNPQSISIKSMLPVEYPEDTNPYESDPLKNQLEPSENESLMTDEVVMKLEPEICLIEQKSTKRKQSEIDSSDDNIEDVDAQGPGPSCFAPRSLKRTKIKGDNMRQQRIAAMADERLQMFKRHQEEEQKKKLELLQIQIVEHEMKLHYMAEEHKANMEYMKCKIEKLKQS